MSTDGDGIKRNEQASQGVKKGGRGGGARCEESGKSGERLEGKKAGEVGKQRNRQTHLVGTVVSSDLLSDDEDLLVSDHLLHNPRKRSPSHAYQHRKRDKKRARGSDQW